MKKIYFFFLFLFIGCSCVGAKEVPNFVSISPQCVEVSDHVVVLPIQVLSINEGSLSKYIDNYQLGKVDHDENYVFSISQLESSFVNHISVDPLKDADGKSFIVYSIADDVDLEVGSPFMHFLLNIEFLDEIPSKISVLGHEVVIGDSSVCRLFNEEETGVVHTEVYVKEKDTFTLHYIVVILILCAIVLLEFLILMKRRKNH